MRSVSPDQDREFVMVNLIKFRAKAKYADGRKTDLTGQQANSLYAPIKYIANIGGRIEFVGHVNEQFGNLKPRWDEVGIVRYPSRTKFFEMVNNPEFEKRAIHKDAGLEVSQVLVTEPLLWKIPGAKRVSDQGDAFTFAQLLKYRKSAKYVSVNKTSMKRTGAEAMELFDIAADEVLGEVGARPLFKTKVEGTLIGDGRTWDEFRLLHFPSQAAYTTYSDTVNKMGDVMKHRNAAISDRYILKVETMPLAKRLALSFATSVLGDPRDLPVERSSDETQDKQAE
ncbi:MAG: hypothetical protein AAF664_24190 [Planctomycetota bacterium]